MPVSHTIDHDRRMVQFTLSGAVELHEITLVVDQAVAAIGDGTGYALLSDHRDVTTPATAAQLESLVDHVHRHGRPLHGQRLAIVTRLAASFGMMRMFSVLAERIPMEVQVFDDIGEAERWLRAR